MIYSMITYFAHLMCFGVWVYAMYSDICEDRQTWIVISFFVFPVGIVRGVYLSLME